MNDYPKKVHLVDGRFMFALPKESTGKPEWTGRQIAAESVTPDMDVVWISAWCVECQDFDTMFWAASDIFDPCQEIDVISFKPKGCKRQPTAYLRVEGELTAQEIMDKYRDNY